MEFCPGAILIDSGARGNQVKKLKAYGLLSRDICPGAKGENLICARSKQDWNTKHLGYFPMDICLGAIDENWFQYKD